MSVKLHCIAQPFWQTRDASALPDHNYLLSRKEAANNVRATRQRKAYEMPAAITEEDYGNYLIKSGRLSGTYVARAFPKPPVKKKGLVAEASGKSEEAAIEALKIMIEERDAERTASRRW